MQIYKTYCTPASNCSLKLINSAINNHWVKQLAFFHFLKSQYINSTVYNYRHRMPEIAIKFGVSVKTLYTYISILKRENLAYDFHQNLSLVSTRVIRQNFKDHRKTKIMINETDNLWVIQCRLYAKVIEYHLVQIYFKESVRRYEAMILNISERQAGNSNQHKRELGEGSLFLPSFSIRNAGGLLDLNERTVSKVLNTLSELQVIDVIKPKINKIANTILPISILKDMPGYLFHGSFCTFQVYGSQIKLLQYPILLKRITRHVYLKYCKSDKCKKYNIL